MKRRGVLLVTILFLSALILVLGLAFLSQQSARYRSAQDLALATRAHGLALAGLEGARVKLERDLLFPPLLAEDQREFSYNELVTRLDGELEGQVTVTLDLGYQDEPFQVLVVRSTGLVGSPESPAARRTIEAELDLAPTIRGTVDPNPDYFRFIRYRDHGGF